MPVMTTYMDYTISQLPFRIIDAKSGRSKLNLPSLAIQAIGHYPRRTLFREGAQFNTFAVVYISGGSGTYRVNGGDEQSVTEGTLFFFFPGATFDFGPGPDAYWDEYFFNLEGSRIEEWLGSWLVEPDRAKRFGHDEALQSKIDRIFSLMESGSPNNSDRAALLVESLLFEFVLKADALPAGGRVDPMSTLMEDLSETVYQPFDPEKLCERHHISLSTLRRTVHKNSGYPLNEYVHRLKIAEAKNILLNTALSVKEIADSLGFKDVFYFSRLFKKFVGISPLAFRKTM